MAETSTQILQDIVNTSGARAAIVVGRDGFVIETTGMLGALDLDTLGASVAMLQSGAESMGTELRIAAFHTLTLEAANAMIMCTPVGDALLVILAPDSKTLGMIRLQVKKHVPKLVQFF
jgi:predicted regulator of Ras-like GTPase activity (Roadblock/LC7/MglB family)